MDERFRYVEAEARRLSTDPPVSPDVGWIVTVLASGVGFIGGGVLLTWLLSLLKRKREEP